MRVRTLDLQNKLKATITQISLYYQIISTRNRFISKAPKLQVREEGGKHALQSCSLTLSSDRSL